MFAATALLTRRSIVSGLVLAALSSVSFAQTPRDTMAGGRQPVHHARGGRPPPGLKDRIKAQNRAAAAIERALRADADFMRSLSALNTRILSTEANLPARFDWRDTNHVTPVRDQQACGSCWVFAAIGAYEASYSIINNESVHVSEQEALDCTFADNNCVAGGWHEVVFLYLQLEGEVGDDSYGYNHVKGLCASNIDRLYFALNWGYVRQEGMPDDVMIPPDLALKQKIQRYGPIASGVSSTVQSATPDVQRSANWDRYFKRYDDGQMNPNWSHDFPNVIFTGTPSNTLKPG
jgi:hypothetical protein